MNLIRNLSTLILFFGILMMTFYISRSYQIDLEKKHGSTKQTLYNQYLKKENELPSDKPSKVFGRMFSQPTVWMGYSDPDTKNMENNNYYTAQTGRNNNSLDSIFSAFSPTSNFKDVENT